MEQLDYITLSLYFVMLLAVAVWVIRKENKNTEDYFLAGRNVGWFVIGASIFASNIGSEHVVGLAGTGAESGMPMAHYELHAWIVLLLGWLFLPFYMRADVFTMPEFLEKRFDARSQLTSGDELTLNGYECLTSKGKSVLKFSKQFMNKIESIKQRGFELKSAKVNFIIYWRKEGMEEEVKIILPEVSFVKMQIPVN